MDKRLKIAYVTERDANDRRGAPYYVSRALQAYCGDVHLIHKLRPRISPAYLLGHPADGFTWVAIPGKLKQMFWRLRKKKYDWQMTHGAARHYAGQIDRRLANGRYDVIFAEQGSVLLAHLETSIPIIYSSDATFAAMAGYYSGFSGFAGPSLRQGHEIERRALERASLFLCHSQWAADSAVRDYGVPPQKVFVLPRFSCLENIPDRRAVLMPKQKKICRLLLVGVDWERKGCEIAVETVNELNGMGVQAELTICGCLPPQGYAPGRHVMLAGYLDKNDAAQRARLEQLYRDASFFILPSRAECMGNVFVEAAAFGLPVAATRTGGVPSVVVEGKTGFLLGPEAGGRHYARVIRAAWENQGKYEQMRCGARSFFESLSAERWGNALFERLRRMLRQGEGREAVSQ